MSLYGKCSFIHYPFTWFSKTNYVHVHINGPKATCIALFARRSARTWVLLILSLTYLLFLVVVDFQKPHKTIPMCVLSRCRDCSFINTFGSFNQWHSLRRPYALMEFWASAIVRCAGWHCDCTPTHTASFTIPKTRKPFFAAAAVGRCGARVSFSPPA